MGRKLTISDAVYQIQKVLLEGVHKESQLYAAAKLISKSDYDDVITERTIENLCGYPLCRNPLPSGQNPNDKNFGKRGRYRISLKERKVYDLQETWLYCSSECLINSRAFSETHLPQKRTDVLNPDVVQRIIDDVSALSISDTRHSTLETKDDVSTLGITPQHKEFSSKFVICEQDQNKTIDSFNSFGPSDAIEGYTPKRDHLNKSAKHSQKKKGLKKAKGERSDASLNGESGFTSEVISGGTHGNLVSDVTLSAASNVAVNSTSGGRKKTQSPCVSETAKSTLSSSLKSHRPKGIRRKVTWADEVSSESNTVCRTGKQDISDFGPNPESYSSNIHDTNSFTTNDKTGAEHSANSSGTIIDSCSTSKEAVSIKNISESNGSDDLESSKSVFNHENVTAARLESAEALAKALAEAAEAVANDEADASEAVSKAGLYILPGDKDSESGKVERDMNDKLRSVDVGLSNIEEVFDARECWYDDPPEGFSLELSPFSTMWMAVDGWITSSSLAYIYGREEIAADEFSVANGREYCRRHVSGDGTSAEIQKTLEGCLVRYLPEVVQSLRLSVPLWSVERALGELVTSMTLLYQVPPFRRKQWHVIVLLFLDALSVHHIPSLSSQLMEKRPLIVKVLEGSEITYEEYELMKQLLIPLGRCPVFSAQCGG
eukprot:TRINITY_DN40764_c0_g1_i1.p1 TRINITY_DN40764_c0_g1~~TRINITY_DN40764_c0_g1_i1.p1  ORF type:complete len:662 (+),score=90.25 TRINITY_DN40764_c0_g1_i1:153-2138(+)